jgi:hypothetical protein
MPGAALYGLGPLYRPGKNLSDILDVVRGKLLLHLLIPHTLAKCNYNRSIGNSRDVVVILGEPLDEGAQ